MLFVGFYSRIDTAKGKFRELFYCGINSSFIKFSVEKFQKISIICVFFRPSAHKCFIMDRLRGFVKEKLVAMYPKKPSGKKYKFFKKSV